MLARCTRRRLDTDFLPVWLGEKKWHYPGSLKSSWSGLLHCPKHTSQKSSCSFAEGPFLAHSRHLRSFCHKGHQTRSVLERQTRLLSSLVEKEPLQARATWSPDGVPSPALFRDKGNEVGANKHAGIRPPVEPNAPVPPPHTHFHYFSFPVTVDSQSYFTFVLGVQQWLDTVI